MEKSKLTKTLAMWSALIEGVKTGKGGEKLP